MAIRSKVQKDYYLTEASLESSTNVAEVDAIMRAAGSTGKIIILYNNGHVQGINVEQRSKISDLQADKIRPLLALSDIPI